MNLKNINWLASFPKSGNTWARAFLRAYQVDAYETININQIGKISRSESRLRYFTKVAGRDGPFNNAEIDELRHEVQRLVASYIGVHQVAKTHNARIVRNGTPMICDEFTRCAIYIVRNPLIVVDSFADHNGLTTDQAIALMNDPEHTIGGPNEVLVTQYLTTWSNHVASWMMADAFPVHITRYEDLLEDPHQRFGEMIRFLGWMVDEERLHRAVKFSSFDVLSEFESQHGFYELSDKSQSGKFFRRGPQASRAHVLSELQANQIYQDHFDIMARFGYAP